MGTVAAGELGTSPDVRPGARLLPRRLRLDPARRRRLMNVAGGRAPADLALVGGRVLNVFGGSCDPATVGIAGGRVAWVSADHGSAREVVDVGGATIIPGLIDCHAHADILCTHDAFAEVAARHGTTTAVVDTLSLVTNVTDDAALVRLLTGLEQAPMKFLWGLREGRDSARSADAAVLPWERLAHHLEAVPDLSGAGELVGWPALFSGDPRLGQWVAAVANAGLRIDGHAPGASRFTLSQLMAAGVTSDHEAIDGAELTSRIELGLWTMVRESSLRRDASKLAEALTESGLPTSRTLLTADGLIPQDLLAGHLDATARAVIAGGVDPVDAVRMGTLNPATYLGLDAHLGAIAPGRCADLIIVDNLETLTPLRVMCDGAFLEPEPPDTMPLGLGWHEMRHALTPAQLSSGRLLEACQAGPLLRADGVITRESAEPSSGGDGQLIALVSRDGTTLIAARIDGLPPLEAVASTYTGYHDVLLIGRDPEELVSAYQAVVELGGGMACPGCAVALPVWGHLRPGPVKRLAQDLDRFERLAGVCADSVPFPFRTLFLSLPALPGVSLTTEGILETSTGRRVGGPVAVSAGPLRPGPGA